MCLIALRKARIIVGRGIGLLFLYFPFALAAQLETANEYLLNINPSVVTDLNPVTEASLIYSLPEDGPAIPLDTEGRVMLEVELLNPALLEDLEPEKIEHPELMGLLEDNVLGGGLAIGFYLQDGTAVRTEVDGEVTDPTKTPPPGFSGENVLPGDVGCKSLVAGIGYDRRHRLPVPNPLRFPKFFTPPKPLSPGFVTGPVTGGYGAGAMQKYVVMTGFYHIARLNGMHGCVSQQYLRELTVGINAKTNELIHIDIDKDSKGNPRLPGLLAGKWYHDSKDYAGSTRTGVRVLGGVSGYQGTPDVIQWLDVPGLDMKKAPGVMNAVMLRYILLKQIVWDSGGKSGTQCDTLTIVAADTVTQKAAAPNKIFPMIKNLKVPANKVGNEKKIYQAAVGVLQKAIKKNLKINPYFIKGDCKRF